jgi:5-(carboxyamino)imidazole ribonucleotide synthase
MKRVIRPGATLGVLGGGQLGRMFTLAAHELGYRVHVLASERNSPCGQAADAEFVASLEDTAQVAEFLAGVDVVTYETENIPVEVIEQASDRIPVCPGRDLLFLSQHRLREKGALRDHGFPVCDFLAIDDPHALRQAVQKLGLPSVLKTASGGYDGKGQWLLRSDTDLAQVAEEVCAAQEPVPVGLPNQANWILESYVPFECEFSVVAVRGSSGEFASYGPIRNDHARHILDVSCCPALLPRTSTQQALQIARDLADTWAIVGVFCIEFFLVADGQVLINEIAPRPHNSGHLTIDAHDSSQFEQQVRAICGLPLGSARQSSPAAMANLLGDLWQAGQPHWEAALADPRVKLHLYGKRDPRVGRKMGHLTVLADSAEEARHLVLSARDRLLQFRHD